MYQCAVSCLVAAQWVFVVWVAWRAADVDVFANDAYAGVDAPDVSEALHGSSSDLRHGLWVAGHLLPGEQAGAFAALFWMPLWLHRLFVSLP
jgi:hypothetical protein